MPCPYCEKPQSSVSSSNIRVRASSSSNIRTKQTKSHRRTRKRRRLSGEHKDMDFNMAEHHEAFVHLLETAADGTDLSMGNPTTTTNFWCEFAKRLIEITQDERVNYDLCVGYIKCLKDIYNGFKHPTMRLACGAASAEYRERLSRLFGRRTVGIPRVQTPQRSSLRVPGSNGTNRTNSNNQRSFGSGSTVAWDSNTRIDAILGQLVYEKKLKYKYVNELQEYINSGLR